MSKAIALVGDWNATPHDKGRYTPSWLASQRGLRIRSAGPGRHGDIDYAMADCKLYGPARFAPPRGASVSDHDVYVVDALEPHHSNHLTIGSWNVLHGRRPATVALQVAQVLREHGIDVLCLQEAAEYHLELEAIPGYVVIAYEGHGQQHNVIMVHQSLPVRRPKLVRLSPLGWRVVTGGRHAPLYATSVVVDWLRVVDVHQPPSVNWTKGGKIHGPPMRVAAYSSAMRRLCSWVKANQRSRP